MQYRTLKVSLDEQGVLFVSLNRPEVRNAFSEEVIDDLIHVFEGEGQGDSVKAIVLRGEGRVFCAGGDLNWMKRSVHCTLQENIQDTTKLARMFSILNQCQKPLIGAIHGAAIGGGVGLVSVCDIAIAVEDTQFSLSEVKLGIVPACIGPFVIPKIGPSHARRFFMSAERFNSRKAAEIGLVHEVVPDLSALQPAVDRLLKNILQCGPHAMKAAKELILNLSVPERRSQLSDPLEYVAKLLAELRVSDEGQEGIRAFLEKRKPRWISDHEKS